MLAKVVSGTIAGFDAAFIEVEVDVAQKGLPSFTIVGLPDKTVDEAKDRVKTAIVNTGYQMPRSRITVNLAPADIPKEGSGFDLPIAVGILIAAKLICCGIQDSAFIGELSLDGNIRRVPGVISIVEMLQKKNIKRVFVPRQNAFEAALVYGIDIYPAGTLQELVFHLSGISVIHKQQVSKICVKDVESDFDFRDVRGQEKAKRALEIAATGFHNVYFHGVPGAGKTMLARSFATILPPLDYAEILEVTKIYSNAGLLSAEPYINSRPFRSPHHTVSRIGLIGGGGKPKPGEISLAHRGVLFLDEFSEFPRSVLESLRQPLEDGYVSVSRIAGSCRFPCRFIMIAASNPCPCGYLGHPKKQCSCTLSMILKYKKRISGPLMDRIDLFVDIEPVSEEKIFAKLSGQSSADIRSRVLAGRKKQKHRFRDLRIISNAEMNMKDIIKYCQFSASGHSLLKQAVSKFSMSVRSYIKTIKVSRTIADLQGKDVIDELCIAEALQYRDQKGI